MENKKSPFSILTFVLALTVSFVSQAFVTPELGAAREDPSNPSTCQNVDVTCNNIGDIVCELGVPEFSGQTRVIYKRGTACTDELTHQP